MTITIRTSRIIDSYDVTDNRARRIYTSRANRATLLLSDGKCDQWAPRSDQFPVDVLCRVLEERAPEAWQEDHPVPGRRGRSWVESFEVSCRGFRDENRIGCTQVLWVNVTLAFRAAKPSHLPSQDIALAQLDQVLDEGVSWADFITSAIDEVWARRAAQVQLAAEVQTANHLLSCMVDEVRQSAKLAVRYEQRLAALRAEYEAEKRVQAARIAEKMRTDGDVWENSGEPIDQRLLNAAVAVLSAHLDESHDGPFGGGPEHAYTYTDADGYTCGSHVDPESLREH